MARSSRASRALIVLAAAVLCGAAAARAASLEAAVKAAYIFNFARFVEWPASAFAAPAANLVIGVVGDCEVGPVLTELIRQEAVGGRKLTVKAVRAGATAGCHILYVCPGAGDEGALLRGVGREGVLLVGESGRFLASGGTIRFYLAENKVRFEVSLSNAAAAGLKLSSRLLKVARVVDKKVTP